MGAAWLELLGLSADSAPGLAAHPAVVTFLQGGLLALGTSGSLVLLAMLNSNIV